MLAKLYHTPLLSIVWHSISSTSELIEMSGLQQESNNSINMQNSSCLAFLLNFLLVHPIFIGSGSTRPNPMKQLKEDLWCLHWLHMWRTVMVTGYTYASIPGMAKFHLFVALCASCGLFICGLFIFCANVTNVFQMQINVIKCFTCRLINFFETGGTIKFVQQILQIMSSQFLKFAGAPWGSLEMGTTC